MFYDYNNSVHMFGEALRYTHTHAYTHHPLMCVCVYVGVVSVCGPPTWIEPGLVHSTAVSFERPKTKSLKSNDLPISCVHLIPLFLTLLSAHSALWPEAAARCHSAAAFEISSVVLLSECFLAADVKAWEFVWCLDLVKKETPRQSNSLVMHKHLHRIYSKRF